MRASGLATAEIVQLPIAGIHKNPSPGGAVRTVNGTLGTFLGVPHSKDPSLLGGETSGDWRILKLVEFRELGLGDGVQN